MVQTQAQSRRQTVTTMSDPRPDPRDPPTICPDCGGDVVQTDADGGYVCEDCGRDLFVLDSRGDGGG